MSSMVKKKKKRHYTDSKSDFKHNRPKILLSKLRLIYMKILNYKPRNRNIILKVST